MAYGAVADPARSGAREGGLAGSSKAPGSLLGLSFALLRELPYVAVLTLDQMSGEVADEIERRKLPAFRIDASITSVDTNVRTDEQHMRCEVSLLVMDEPDLTLRSVLKGAASGSEQLRSERSLQLRTLAGKTLESAVRSALGNVQQAVEAAAVRRDLGMPDLAAEAALTRTAR